MRKEFVVVSVAASPDRRSGVVVSLLEENSVIPEKILLSSCLVGGTSFSYL
jgi:hypothetical protein